MKAIDLRFCLAIAKDPSIDVSKADDSILFGFGLAEFEPVTASIKAVARCIRWQCQRFDGTFDEAQFNADRPHYLRKVELSDLTADDARQLLLYVSNFGLRAA
jgi:hypothetical protein